MSGYKAAWVECDGCGQSYPGDLGSNTISEVRRETSKMGWRSRLGKDWCPDCRKKRGL